ncbi:phosphatidylserine/phosphatidylglycerophosphate/cardiolipin synthase-like enzyme [Bradyrhizobium huanghuaihaiense]
MARVPSAAALREAGADMGARGERAAVSVNTAPERSYNTRLNLAVARYLPSLAEAAVRVFALEYSFASGRR